MVKLVWFYTISRLVFISVRNTDCENPRKWFRYSTSGILSNQNLNRNLGVFLRCPVSHRSWQYLFPRCVKKTWLSGGDFSVWTTFWPVDGVAYNYTSLHSVCWRFGVWDPDGFESCSQQRKTTSLLSIRMSLACARASKLTTTNIPT